MLIVYIEVILACIVSALILLLFYSLRPFPEDM